MKKLLLSLALAAFATSSMALGFGNDNPASGGTNINTNAPHQDQGQAQGQAQGQLQGQGQAQGQATIVGVAVSNRITNDVRQNAAAFAGGGEAVSNSGGNRLSNSSSANNGGNVQSVTVTDSGKMNYSGSYDVKNVPSVFSGNVYPTAPCMGSSTVGGAGVGFGFSVGSSWKDDDCGIRETARSFASMQMSDDAITVLCTSEYAKTAPSCVAKAAKKAEDDAKATQQ